MKAQYIVVTYTKDFDGDYNRAPYYVNGTEAAWELFTKLSELFEQVELIDYADFTLLADSRVCEDIEDVDDDDPFEEDEEDIMDRDLEDWMDYFFGD